MNLELVRTRSHAAPAPHGAHAGVLPGAPRTLADTGLSDQFVIELATKVLVLRGQQRLTELAHHLRLPAIVVEELLEFMRAERLVELVRRGATHGDAVFALTELGRSRAIEGLRRCRYAGAAPVPVEAYVAQVRRQSVSGMKVTRADVERAYEGLILRQELREQIGAAMNSGRPLFFYGPAGSGKTYLAESLARLLQGHAAVPHAFLVDGEIVQVFDPLVHRPVVEGHNDAGLDARQRSDARWLLCERPVVLVGGELRLEMLDLQFDASAGFYQAPPHVKANNGLFIVDDLGRQIVKPEQLMNRWIVPMDRRRDYLALHTGTSFELPFDMVLVFSTNLTPSDVADEAFLRRLGYKMFIGPTGENDYREMLRLACAQRQVPYVDQAFADLLALHRRHERPTLACYPRDLVGLIADFATYMGETPALTPAAFERAWHNYFAAQ
ncbi:MAG TPA: ATP-binding protein [Burkholderiaceae bacterium]|nr:ATP-binding protein [Burkholderiaceae bacterium]